MEPGPRLRSLVRHTAGSTALALAACGLSAPTSAAQLASASFAIDSRAGSGLLPILTMPGVGATGTATSNLSASLSGTGVFDGSVTTILPTTAAPPLTAVQLVITKNASATFAGTAPGNVGGNLAIEGTLAFYGLGGFPTVPLLSVPLKLGTPNTIGQSTGGVAITAIAGSWTAGTAIVTSVALTDTSADHTVTAMGSNALTPGGAGTLVLVSPLKVISGIAGNFANFGVLTLTYVPEPGTLLLLGLGVAGLGAVGRRRAAAVRRAGVGRSILVRTLTLRRWVPGGDRLRLALALTGAVATGGPASAGTLTSASFGFVLATLPSATIVGTGATGTATSNLSASLDAGTAFDGAVTVTTTPTPVAVVVTALQVIVTKNGGQTFTGSTPAKVGGDLAIEGVVNVYGAGYSPGGPPLLSVPLHVGTPHTNFLVAGVAITTVAASWTAGTAAVPLTLPSGSPTMMGSNALTPGGGGTLVLVTPLLVRTSAIGSIAAFGTLTLTYVPEPGTLLLLGIGVASLAALGRKRRRSRLDRAGAASECSGA